MKSAYTCMLIDMQLDLAFNPEIIQEGVAQMQACKCEIKSWLCDNSLKMNDSKTEVLVLESKSLLATLPKISLKIGTVSITTTKTAKNIGAIFDDILCMVGSILAMLGDLTICKYGM